MSLRVKYAKGSYRGDPGLFSFIGGAAKTLAKGAVGFLTGGPLGAAGAMLPTLFPAAPGKTTSPPLIPMGAPLANLPQGAMPGTGIQIQLPRAGGVSMGGIEIGSFTGQGSVPGGQVQPGASTGTQLCRLPSGGAVMRATHANKSGYFLKSGQYVAPGTKCVTNRRMNPLNPRAASRAMRRLTAAKRAARFLGAITIRKGARGCGCR